MKKEVVVAMALMGAFAWAIELGETRENQLGNQVSCKTAGQPCRLFFNSCCDGLSCSGGKCERNCYPPGQSCGPLHRCCEGLDCKITGFWIGVCERDPACRTKGDKCALLTRCCYPYICSSAMAHLGICVEITNELPASSASASASASDHSSLTAQLI